ncbi:hypothetical protein NDU88_012611 [Pleurodeles waltl]|uniref:Uncharacterized protein n=1 Tax=Pleurodeles waltl TaxID=8319 RepID=A0AAV7R2F1_PLEWA|nr:hypothetical protein NDU88_012611 [Pleurodeles waltl]
MGAGLREELSDLNVVKEEGHDWSGGRRNVQSFQSQAVKPVRTGSIFWGKAWMFSPSVFWETTETDLVPMASILQINEFTAEKEEFRSGVQMVLHSLYALHQPCHSGVEAHNA